MKKALFIAGGWDGHQPDKIVQLFSADLRQANFATDIESSLDVLADAERLKTYDVISPCWTMGSLTKEQGEGLQSAVRGGVALAGIHGGMGDAFRGNLDFEWMAGGHFVGHPHVGDYAVRIKDFDSPITRGLPGSFTYHSEQYYMMMDPAVHVLAETEYVYEGRHCTMPVAWIRMWGKGRVFYSSLGHDPAEFEKFPEARALTVRGLRWAAGDL
jgi:type 1 glutamine amidotransferase